MGITESVLRPALTRDAARPLITHYDDRLGSRIELSVATTANWAAKTANWLRDEADLELGDPVALKLPAHWQTLGILFGIWWAGGDVRAASQGASVAFVPPGESAEGAGLTAEVSLHPMGLGLDGAPADGAIDFIEDVRLHGDEYVAIEPAGQDTPALNGRGTAQVLEAVRARAGELGVESGARVLSTAEWSIPNGLFDVLAVLDAGGSLVQCAGVTDADKLEERARTERCTLRLPA